MTLILVIATFGVLTFLGLSCRRARLDLEEQLCECQRPPVPAGQASRRHLRVVEAG